MYHVVAATTNPAKIRAISCAFDDAYGAGLCRIEGVDVSSDVAQQPLSNAETRRGARNRVMNARQVRPEADFWVSIEAGIEENMTFAWMVIENAHQRGEARSASLMLPEIVLQGIAQGRELGEEMAKLTGIGDIKQQGGAISVFTAGKLTRSSVYYQALLLALAPLRNEIYRQPPSRHD